MGAQTQAACEAQAFLDARQLTLQACLIAVPRRHGPKAGVQLDARGTGFRGGFNLHRIGADEQGDTAARGGQTRAGVLHAIELTGHIQPALGGDLLTALGHQANMSAPCAR